MDRIKEIKGQSLRRSMNIRESTFRGTGNLENSHFKEVKR